jgi:hypothetical protein
MTPNFSTNFFAVVLGILIIAGATIGSIRLNEYLKIEKEKNTELAYIISGLERSLNSTQREVEDIRLRIGGSLNNLEEAQKVNNKLTTTLAEERELRLQGESALRSEFQKSALTDVSAVIREWQPRIAHITCTWANGQRSVGSGLLLGKFGSSYHIQTNRHVVYIDNSSPLNCTVQLPGDEIVLGDELNINTASDIDSAQIIVSGPSRKMTAYAVSVLGKACSVKGDVGEPIVVLGYPDIGSPQDITATEGIISGYDKNYYVTSAKIEQGTSGGVAISIKNNCYLGIPTLTYVGKVESLGRILDWKSISP